MVRHYELMVVLSGQSSQEDVKSFVSAVEKLVLAKKGVLENVEMLGRRTLAFEVKKQREGYYVLFRIALDGSIAQGFERDVRLMEAVLRYLFILYDEKKQVAAQQLATEPVQEEKE